MISKKKIIRANLATKFIFLVCGIGISSWAPMVPLAKDRLQLNESQLGILLLMLGGGALIMMPIAGLMIRRAGSRKVILAGVVVVAFFLPWLLAIKNTYLMGLLLLLFGCGIGTVDVAMNSQGVQVQNAYGKPIMSSLHGLFSVGGLVGSIGLGVLIKAGLDPIFAAITISACLLAFLFIQYSNLLSHASEQDIAREFSHVGETVMDKKRFQWLRGTVIILGFMCFIVFLAEGAMLDWSAIFLRDHKGIESEFSGVGYAAFSIAMAIMRLTGDFLISKLSNKIVVIGGSLLSSFGILILIFGPGIPLSLFGFILLGIGAANIVPVFFSEGGRIKGLSPNVTIPVISTMGYAGQLAGPALLGFLAHHFSLTVAFESIALLFVIVAIIYKLRN